MSSSSEPTVDAVVLTMNDRADEFPRAMASLLAQQDVDLRVVIVGNGGTPDHVPDGVQTVVMPENVAAAGLPGLGGGV